MSSDLEKFIKALLSDDEADRLYAVDDIASTGDPSAAKTLAERLESEKSQAVSDAIVFALKKLDCKETLDLLFGMFSSPNAFLRNAAVTIFGANGEGTLDFLMERYASSNKEIRKLILDSLMEIGTPKAAQAIRWGLLDEAENVKITAAEYLGRLCDKESIGDILQILEIDPEPMMRVSIMEALVSFEDKTVYDQVTYVVCPDGDLKKTDPIYIPQLIKLAVRSGRIDDVKKIFKSIENVGLYADDILNAVVELRRREKVDIADLEAGYILKKICEMNELRPDIINLAKRLVNTRKEPETPGES
ncbi:MAG: HEAT repeat domain-containing protein [Candidatus Riflebacteria bacterium]|nr:HEAT repeat domain-containing protein [Candidatus Riflebacteria bacterium]